VGELGQLVQEEYASMAKRNLPRARLPAAAHQSRMRDGVMRRPERPLPDQWRVRWQHSGHAIYLRDLQGLLHRQAGQYRGRRPREQRFPGAGRADHDHIVPTRRCHLERPLYVLLALDMTEIYAFRRLARRQRANAVRRKRPDRVQRL